MNLLLLAPGLQVKPLCLPSIERGRNPITETQLRPIAAMSILEQAKVDVATLSARGRHGVK
jgi:hypothetical protein